MICRETQFACVFKNVEKRGEQNVSKCTFAVARMWHKNFWAVAKGRGKKT